MLLNWENTSATFPSFVENFSAWTTAVAQTAGDYSTFESQVKGIRTDNPLGWNSGGITDSYVATSTYANALTHEELDEYAASKAMYDLVGAYYVDTGMESQLKKTTFWSAFGEVMSVVGIVARGMSIVKGLGAPTASNSIHVAAVASINSVVVNKPRKPRKYKGFRGFSFFKKL